MAALPPGHPRGGAPTTGGFAVLNVPRPALAPALAKGYGSLDTKSWTRIAEHDFDEPLRFQGWGAASHGSESVKFLFGLPAAAPVSFAAQRAIGKDVKVGRFFAGVYP